MPQTYRDYSVKEAFIALFHGGRLGSGHERATWGDIISVSEPRRGIGLMEMAHFLRLRLYGLQSDEMYALMEPLPGDTHTESLGLAHYDKRRYCIPLDRLKQIYPAFDIAAARNPNVIYQPFLPVDVETGLYLAQAASPLSVFGLVFDKITRRYL